MEIEAYLHHRGRLAHEPVACERVSTTAPEQAEVLFRAGIRRVVFTEPICLTDDSARPPLDLLRELEAWGVLVDWTAAEIPAEWKSFAHLPPPAGTGAELEEWCTAFHPGKCVLRQGPGFIQVRDRRSGVLDCYTIDEPFLQGVVNQLAAGLSPNDCDPDAVALLIEHDLVVRAGELAWWAPARLRRWPVPAMAM